MATNEIMATITLRDNMTASLKKIRLEYGALRDDIRSTVKEIESASNQVLTINVDAEAATKSVEQFKEMYDSIGSKNVTLTVDKHKATGKLKAVKNMASSLGKKLYTPTVAIKDLTSKGLSTVKKSLVGLMKSSISIDNPVEKGVEFLKGAIDSGMALDNQNIIMENSISNNHQGMDKEQVKALRASFVSNLKENAGATSFDTGDVIAAGNKAINMAGGDTGSAMAFVKLAEDMAALNPEKSISDALDAISGLKSGDTEGVSEFGFKISPEDIDTAGGVDAVIKNQLTPFFEGGAEKMSQSASGMIAILKGNVTSRIQDFGLGIVEQIKPALEAVTTFMIDNGPAIDQFTGIISSGIGFVIDKIGSFVGFVTSNMPLIKEKIGLAATFISEKFGWIGTKGDFLKEVLSKAFKGIKEVVQVVAPIVETVLGTIGTAIGILVEGFEWAFPYIEDILGKTWDFIKPILEGIQGGVELISKGYETLFNLISGKESNDKKNLTATGDEKLKIDGSEKTGLSRVPYDGFIAELHKDERVLTKQEATIYRKQSNSQNTNVFYKFIDKLADTIVIRESADAEQILRQLNDGIAEAAMNMA